MFLLLFGSFPVDSGILYMHYTVINLFHIMTNVTLLYELWQCKKAKYLFLSYSFLKTYLLISKFRMVLVVIGCLSN